ncbi:hypothetical protein HK405_012224 [Cladochytrium tenue]|nr:hypothetical protein HK405_012224 [Cladochytrium tenue]
MVFVYPAGARGQRRHAAVAVVLLAVLLLAIGVLTASAAPVANPAPAPAPVPAPAPTGNHDRAGRSNNARPAGYSSPDPSSSRRRRNNNPAGGVAQRSFFNRLAHRLRGQNSGGSPTSPGRRTNGADGRGQERQGLLARLGIRRNRNRPNRQSTGPHGGDGQHAGSYSRPGPGRNSGSQASSPAISVNSIPNSLASSNYGGHSPIVPPTNLASELTANRNARPGVYYTSGSPPSPGPIDPRVATPSRLLLGKEFDPKTSYADSFKKSGAGSGEGSSGGPADSSFVP